jgi:hypothetical protein
VRVVIVSVVVVSVFVVALLVLGVLVVLVDVDDDDDVVVLVVVDVLELVEVEVVDVWVVSVVVVDVEVKSTQPSGCGDAIRKDLNRFAATIALPSMVQASPPLKSSAKKTSLSDDANHLISALIFFAVTESGSKTTLAPICTDIL